MCTFFGFYYDTAGQRQDIEPAQCVGGEPPDGRWWWAGLMYEGSVGLCVVMGGGSVVYFSVWVVRQQFSDPNSVFTAKFVLITLFYCTVMCSYCQSDSRVLVHSEKDHCYFTVLV